MVCGGDRCMSRYVNVCRFCCLTPVLRKRSRVSVQLEHSAPILTVAASPGSVRTVRHSHAVHAQLLCREAHAGGLCCSHARSVDVASGTLLCERKGCEHSGGLPFGKLVGFPLAPSNTPQYFVHSLLLHSNF